jgi:hypothetical protein
MFYALSTNPSLQSKINLFVAMAPVVNLDHSNFDLLKNWDKISSTLKMVDK